ncbi:MAG TPA: hypothetical protein VK605_08370 [Solirubrobacteraceae bacterium]|nr:hypothetical protein [Solirubrobacteraceae bacterium]
MLVIADGPERQVVMEEWVEPEHVRSDHSAAQLIERLSWGVEDAARAEQRLRRMVAPKRLREGATARSYLEIAE